MLLTLPTPSEFHAFPYSPPYSVQTDLMRHLYEAMEHRKIAIVESPTGTGKTLSLLCASLTWLADDKDRVLKGRLAALQDSFDGKDEPAWVLAQTFDIHKRELQAADNDFEKRLAKARRKEVVLRKMEKARISKKPKLGHGIEEVNDDEFLPEYPSEVGDNDINISPAVQELMRKLKQSHSKDYDPNAVATETACTKIFYASRTHSQLSQIIPELKRLKFKLSVSQTEMIPGRVGFLDEEVMKDPEPRMVSLASRTHLCINEDLRASGSDLDEGCRELLSEQKGKGCPHFPVLDNGARMLDLHDRILSSPKDIEDLVQAGKSTQTCPYFGSRRAIAQAELVVLPYNLLLQKSAREAIGIDLTDQIIIIDEAHNLIDAILHLHSIYLPAVTVSTCLSQLNAYLERFRTRLSSAHALHLKRLIEFLTALQSFIAAWEDSVLCRRGSQSQKEEVMTVSQLVHKLGSKVDGMNLIEIHSYLRNSKIARKISGYNNKMVAKAASEDPARVTRIKCDTTPPLHVIESLILALTNDMDDGRITLSLSSDQDKEIVHMKYQHLNPSTHFTEIAEVARCVVLAGGTLSPVSDLITQLFPRLSPERLSSFSCGHVIPPNNLQCLVISKGPRGIDLQLKYSRRGDKTIMEELGQIMFNVVNIIPDGMVVFFPSYAFLETAQSIWTQNGLLKKLRIKKTLFFEPREASDVEIVLRDYALAVHSQKKDDSHKGGALLFAVVGAKLSEGLNFSDELARAVILVGLPFANLGSAELKERMKYVNDLEKKVGKQKSGTKDAGMELYENLCMRAVNQSIGRAIRHKDDWSSLILIDSRYGTSRIRDKLPHWIGRDIIITQGFGQAIKALAQFYRDKRTR